MMVSSTVSEESLARDTHARTHVRTHARTYARTHVRTHARTHTTHTHRHAHTLRHTHTHTYTRTHARTHTHVRTHARMHAHRQILASISKKIRVSDFSTMCDQKTSVCICDTNKWIFLCLMSCVQSRHHRLADATRCQVNPLYLKMCRGICNRFVRA